MITQFYSALYFYLLKDGTGGKSTQQASLAVDTFFLGNAGGVLHANEDFTPGCLEALVLHH